ncbi:RNA methyltransferase, RsmD family [Bifidobacterium actinocoloniiforme DSM 22766]|uniref:RNA methyltransferase, RsmD family n=1 Tax=Bifidobacterium actinocoloniiforme DSM 22766 TaxID=1437605 RepID=A0A086Z263_9BIFI|nr:RsmD family RNA methyltransferase [Bifidobacterium actinocoloniiforme]AKV55969.1 hypothetical protein AB656_07280 [Bifidobacterium actinocoloniiforme DSM 22766]KFI40613.1 RNA methyltransferase, RsmD family [Bifidobacterium actinocoloniiforme DSM 22766]
MRVIAGRFKGAAIPSALKGTRPTTDRTKEAMFSRLDAWGALSGARVLDLYAGTGALGFEALSRGGRGLVAVEASRRAAGLISRTLAALKASPAWGEDDSAQVLSVKVERFLEAEVERSRESHAERSFDLIFIDPPYALPSADCDRILDSLAARGLALSGCLVVLERSARSEPPQLPEGWSLDDERTYGETRVYYISRI